MAKLKKTLSSADQVGMRLWATSLIGLLSFGLTAGACGGGSEFVLDAESTPSLDSFGGHAESTDGLTPGVSDEEGYVELEHEMDAHDAVWGRADLRLESVVVAARGVFDLTVSMESLDKAAVLAPVVSVGLSEGVVLSSAPAACEAVGAGLDCVLDSFFSSGTYPHSSESIVLTLGVESGAVGQRVTLVATSDGNPVSNDPDPTNNTVVHELS